MPCFVENLKNVKNVNRFSRIAARQSRSFLSYFFVKRKLDTFVFHKE